MHANESRKLNQLSFFATDSLLCLPLSIILNTLVPMVHSFPSLTTSSMYQIKIAARLPMRKISWISNVQNHGHIFNTQKRKERMQ